MIFKIFFGAMGLIMLVLFLQMGSDMQINGETTDCFDRYSNKIIGENCIVENSFDNKEVALLFSGLVGLGFFFMFMVIGIMLDESRRGGRY